ncbi:MAG TPA: 3'(2'),5'-bisphosphate nucleotidase CysQ [Gemmatimonadales bacterium]
MTSASLDQLGAIAREAGAAAMRFYGEKGGVELKADRSPVTRADRAAHDVIVRSLTSLDLGIPLISEEGAVVPYEERRGWTRFWLVDPLDGTKEFLQQNGEFTVNIALIENGEPVRGVVYAPAIDVLYSAGRGAGSWKHEAGASRRLLGPGAPGPEGIVVVESRSHPSAQLEAFLATIKVARRVQAGSSLKFGVVAEGKAHCYPRFGPTHDWDVAAGDCVWRNAVPEGAAERASPIVYNTPDLLNPGFVIGVLS